MGRALDRSAKCIYSTHGKPGLLDHAITVDPSVVGRFGYVSVPAADQPLSAQCNTLHILK